MNEKVFIKMIESNYNIIDLDDELNKSDVEIMYICLLCEKMYGISIETSSFFDIYYKYINNEVGISSYVIFINDNILYVEIVNGEVICTTSDYDTIIKNVNYVIEESGCSDVQF